MCSQGKADAALAGSFGSLARHTDRNAPAGEEGVMYGAATSS